MKAINKNFILTIILFFLPASIMAKNCEFTRLSIPGETKYVEQHSIKTDRDGHAVRIFKTETKYKDSKANCDGLKAISGSFWGFSDYTFKNGKVSGYWTTIYDDGSTMYGTWQGTSQSPKDQSKNSLNISTQKISGGSGVYSNVTGYGISKGEFNPETGYSRNELTIFFNKN